MGTDNLKDYFYSVTNTAIEWFRMHETNIKYETLKASSNLYEHILLLIRVTGLELLRSRTLHQSFSKYNPWADISTQTIIIDPR